MQDRYSNLYFLRIASKEHVRGVRDRRRTSNGMASSRSASEILLRRNEVELRVRIHNS